MLILGGNMKISNINLVTFNDESKVDSFYASNKCRMHYADKHWHDFYEIHVITDGAITERINGHEIEMGPGWIYFLKPYDVHEYWADKPVTMYKIQFLIDILEPSIQQKLISSDYRLVTKLSDSDLARLIPFLSKIVEERNSNKPERLMMISYLMNCLAIEMIRLSSKQTHRVANSDPIVLALEYLHRNYTKDITMGQVADHVGLSPNYFCSKFHNEIGQSFKHYLRGLQLNHAATLLRVSDLSVSRVCEESGINSFAHFLKDFKAYYGMTPSQYRKQSTVTE